MHRLVIFSLVLFSSISIAEMFGQTSTVLEGAYIPDGAYIRTGNLGKRVIRYPHLREADVMYTKRVWQVIDFKEKINQPFYYPLKPIKSSTFELRNLFDVIRKALLSPEIQTLTAYGLGPAADDDLFRFPLSFSQVDSILNPPRPVTIYDEEGFAKTGIREEIGIEMVPKPLESSDIVALKIKEDWIWDRQRGERYVRIIGIAPMIRVEAVDGTTLPPRELFWLYYPHARYVLAHADCFNPMNDASRRTFEDIFQKRFFNSYIVKESNVYNRTIQSYARGADALAESERIKEELFLLEHDLWHY